MKHLFHQSRRLGFGLAAAITSAAFAVPALVPTMASAAVTQVQTRSIQMSDALPTGTNVTYKVTFTPQAASVGGIVVDFCDDSPLIGSATCTQPTGFDLHSA